MTGAELYIDTQGANIDVLGTLVANGTEMEPVLITAQVSQIRSGENPDTEGVTRGVILQSPGSYPARVAARVGSRSFPAFAR